MKAETRLFGTIDIEDEKIIELVNGMIGFPEFKHFALIFDEEKGFKNSKIMWLQSMDFPDTAFPVMNPSLVKKDYNPEVENETLKPLGDLNENNTFILVTVTATGNKLTTTVNLKAPIVINLDTNKGSQLIVENDEYPVKFRICDADTKKN